MNNGLDISNIAILCQKELNTFYILSSTATIDEVTEVCNSEMYKENSFIFLGKHSLQHNEVMNALPDELFTIALINSDNDAHIVFNRINQPQALWIIDNHKQNDSIFVFKSNAAVSADEYLEEKLTIGKLSSIYNSNVAHAIISFGVDLFDTINVENNLISITYEDNAEVELYNAEEFLQALISAGNSIIEEGISPFLGEIKSCVSVFEEYLLTQEKSLLDLYKKCFGDLTWENISDWMKVNDLHFRQPIDSFITIGNTAELIQYSFQTVEEFLLFILKDAMTDRCIADHNGILGELMYRQFPLFEMMFGEELWTAISDMLDEQESALIMDKDKLFIVRISDLSSLEIDKKYLIELCSNTKTTSNQEADKIHPIVKRGISTSSKKPPIGKAFSRVNFANYTHIDIANILNKYVEHIYVDPFNQLYRVIPGSDDILISAVPITFKDVLKDVFDTLYELEVQSRIANDVAMSEMVIEELEMLSQYI